jgi:hypothetical protein
MQCFGQGKPGGTERSGTGSRKAGLVLNRITGFENELTDLIGRLVSKARLSSMSIMFRASGSA